MGAIPSLYAILRNARLNSQQWIVPRAGLVAISATPFDALPVHSIKRLNDKLLGLFPKVYGAGTKLYLGEGTAAVDNLYSGQPLSMFAFRPEGSPQPWMYVADRLKLRKIRSDGLLHSVGIEPPLAAPTVTFGAPASQTISDFATVGAWTNAGTAGAISVVNRMNTTIARILYDAGTTGWANIQPTVMTDQIQKDMLATFNTGGGNQETALVNDVYPPMAPTTIGSIVYDAGTTGLCFIQPAAGSTAKSHYPYQPGVGDGGKGSRTPRFPVRQPRGRGRSQIVVAGTFTGDPQPNPPAPPVRSSSMKPVGVQANSLVRINSGGGSDETVRVLALALGKDGQISFRCSTVNTHVAGETLGGLPSFRCFLNNNHVAAETLTETAFQTSLTSGIGLLSLVTPFNLGVVAGRAVQEDDEIHISLRLDHPEFLTEMRVIFDVDSATNDFAHNFMFYALRQSDMQQAITSGQTTLAARQVALTRAYLAGYSRNLAQRQLGPNVADSQGGGLGTGQDLTGTDVSFRPGGRIGTSSQANTGASQWTEFRFKVSDLIRVGADTTRNLGNVGGIRIQLTVTSAVVANLSAFWIGGTYGPDIGTSGSPIFYRFRARSKVTGAKSLAGPATRFPIEPHRQRVSGTMAQHPNPAADTLDVFRFGGTLDQWYYVLSTPNSANPTFNDDLDDTSVQVHPTLDLDVFQPFPTIDLPTSGTCNVVGAKVVALTGNFKTAWYPGSQINIGGVYYTLYSQPIDTTHLEIVENAGTQNNVPWFINNATLLGQPMPSWWGPYAEGSAAFFFACGDAFQPGVLFLTNGNDPDSAADTLQIEVTSPSEPLVNGGIYLGMPFVFTSEGLFQLYPNIGQSAQLFIPRRVANAQGLFARWALAQGRFVYALGKDGIYKTDLATYESITNADLNILFPHDGQPGQAITLGATTVNPPDMTQTGNLRLSCYDDHLYFDFLDTLGVQRTLVYDEIFNVWGIDDYTPSVLTHYGDEGEGFHGIVCGGTDGRAYLMSGSQDGGADFPVEMRFPQIGEYATAYHMVPNGILGLISTSAINLVVNMDGTDNIAAVPSTAGKFVRVFQWCPPGKGKLLAFALVGTKGFSLNRRECQFQIGAWGREQTSQLIASGFMGPQNPFADLRRSYAAKVS
jgi:hypothetical protein